ncbi:hypothetical protein SGRIM128S_04881 [Streptomyces griseomycini]
MWCTTRTRRCSPGPVAVNHARNGGSAARSNSWVAAVCGSCCGALSTTVSGSPTSVMSSTRWNGSPPAWPITVRRLSCRSTTSRSAAARAATSTAPVSRTVKGMLYVAERPDNSPRNQSRCWAKDTGSRSGRCRGARTGGRGLPPVPGSSRASASTVCAAYRSAMSRSMPSSARARLTRRVASSE